MTTNTPKPHRFSPALLLLLGAVAIGTLTGCRSEMFDMEYGEPLEKSEFFADKRMSRTLVPGTVARNHLREDSLLYAGKDASGADATVFPMKMDEAAILRGKDRFNIYCSPCHGRTGRGDGIIVQRGMKKPPSLHDPRLRQAPVGYFFNVITNGFGMMYSYASRIKPEDRWKIIAYVRALQRSEGGVTTDTATTVPVNPATPATQGSGDTAATTTTSTGTQAHN